ncbi:MAG: nitroreductase family protein [Candidatus Cloacimonas sp.]|nr:nitroreductase family protein [Candidatus Cloacimonas sp.]
MIHELVEKNRSYRRFIEDKQLEPEILTQLIGLARISPSAANLQNLRYCPISAVDDCAKIFPLLKWANYLRYWDGPAQGERPTAYIIILAPANTTKFHHLDAGIAAQTILLGAVEKGLGGCMLASVDKIKVHDLLSLPVTMEVLLVIALGYPAETVIIEDVTDPDDIEYWRDEEGCHHVPKRLLKDLIITL